MPQLPRFIEDALDAVEMYLREGFQAAANHFNTKRGI
jgi:hypothetical protein